MVDFVVEIVFFVFFMVFFVFFVVVVFGNVGEEVVLLVDGLLVN